MPALTATLGGRLPLHGRRLSPRQEEVLDAVEQIFLHDGLDVTVGELASRASCSRRTLYELAPSKEELLLVVLDRMMRRVGKAAREAGAAQRTPEAQMEAFLGAGVAGFSPLTAAFMQAIESYGPAGWLYSYHLSLTRDFLVETIENGIESGYFRKVHAGLAAEALLAAVRRVTDRELLRANRLSTGEALEELFSMVVHGLVDEDAVRGKKPRRARTRAREVHDAAVNARRPPTRS